MKELYLITIRGEEGIEKIVYPTINKEDAINTLNQILKELDESQKKYGEMWRNGEIDKLCDMLFEKKITQKELDYAHQDPDEYCIMKWNGENFSCNCTELKREKT
jgi:hypothetical protein